MKATLEHIEKNDSQSFEAFIYDSKHFDAPWHFHPYYELTYIEKGSGIRYVGDSIEKFSEGELVMLGTNLPHCWKDTGEPNVRSVIIQWQDDFLGLGWKRKPEFAKIAELLKRSGKGLKFSELIAIEVQLKMNKIVHASGFERMGIFLDILNQLSESSDYKILSKSGFKASTTEQSTNRINKVYAFVASRYQTKIKLSEIASELALSEEAFCRFFKKALNKSFVTYVNEYRINMACRLLLETDKHVSEVAFACGYESLPFFYRQFKRIVKISPLGYRKRQKSNII